MNRRDFIRDMAVVAAGAAVIGAGGLASTLDPFSEKDLLKAHATMMTALVDEAGKFRTGGVGVFAGKQVFHVAPPAGQVPLLIANLFDWLRNSKDHLLIRSCVFHYEFEFIHPFSDGNGRTGRLWQSLILAKLNPVFLHLPVETIVHNNQNGYYQAINDSTAKADSGIFVDFMLERILEALKQHQDTRLGGVNSGVNGGVNEMEAVFGYIKEHPGLRANALAAEMSIPKRTLERHLKQLKESGRIKFSGAPKTGGYFSKD